MANLACQWVVQDLLGVQTTSWTTWYPRKNVATRCPLGNHLGQLFCAMDFVEPFIGWDTDGFVCPAVA